MNVGAIFVVILSIAGNLLSMATAISPIKTFLDMDRTRDTGTMNIYPIMALCGNSFFWVVYGLLTTKFTILPVNTFGLFSTLYYIFIFISSTNDYFKRRKLTAIFLAFIVSLAVYTEIISMALTTDTAITVMGFSCNVILFIFYGAPALGIYQVIKTKDTSTMYPPLLLTSCLAAIVWTLYGVLEKDKFIIVPNFAGAVISFSQLIIYQIINGLYPKGRVLPGVDPNNVTFIDEEKQMDMEMEMDGAELLDEKI